MSIGTRLFTWFYGELVGEDSFGNRYFKSRKGARRRRWVLYNGEAEASRVPPEWHAWLHHTIAEVPSQRAPMPWEKEHIPNLTGTAAAYKPPGAVDHGGQRPRVTGDYEAWRPE